MSNIGQGQYFIESAEYKSQVIACFEDGRGSSAVPFCDRRIYVVLFSCWQRIYYWRRPDRTSSLLVTQLGFNQLVQWLVVGDVKSGYTIQNYQTQKFLAPDASGDVVAGDSTIWDIVSESQERYKFVCAAVVVDCH